MSEKTEAPAKVRTPMGALAPQAETAPGSPFGGKTGKDLQMKIAVGYGKLLTAAQCARVAYALIVQAATSGDAELKALVDIEAEKPDGRGRKKGS